MVPTQAVIGTKVKGSPAWLTPAAAASYARMRAAGMPAGGITDAGRTFAEQAAMYALYLAGKLKATAAVPGTSKHEKGNALDLAGDAQSWVRANGARFGWLIDRVPNEPWHMEYVAARDTAAATPTPAPRRSPDMLVIRGIEKPEVYVYNGVAKRHLPTQAAVNEHLAALGQEAPAIWGQFNVDRIPDADAAGAPTAMGATPAQVADELARRLTA